MPPPHSSSPSLSSTTSLIAVSNNEFIDQLKDAVTQTLEKNGILASFRTQLRQHVAKAINDNNHIEYTNQQQVKVDTTQKKVHPHANTLKSSLHQSVISLMIDYCQCMELTQTLSALCAETESESDNVDRNKLSQQIQVNTVDKSIPILCALVQTSQTVNNTQKTYTPPTVTSKASTVMMTPERQSAALTSSTSLFHRLASPLDDNEAKSNERPTTAPIDTAQKKFGRRAVSFDENEQDNDDKPIANIPLEENKQRPSTAPAPAPASTSTPAPSNIKLSSSLTSLASLPSLTAPRNKLGSLPSTSTPVVRSEEKSSAVSSAAPSEIEDDIIADDTDLIVKDDIVLTDSDLDVARDSDEARQEIVTDTDVSAVISADEDQIIETDDEIKPRNKYQSTDDSSSEIVDEVDDQQPTKNTQPSFGRRSRHKAEPAQSESNPKAKVESEADADLRRLEEIERQLAEYELQSADDKNGQKQEESDAAYDEDFESADHSDSNTKQTKRSSTTTTAHTNDNDDIDEDIEEDIEIDMDDDDDNDNNGKSMTKNANDDDVEVEFDIGDADDNTDDDNGAYSDDDITDQNFHKRFDHFEAAKLKTSMKK